MTAKVSAAARDSQSALSRKSPDYAWDIAPVIPSAARALSQFEIKDS